MGPAGGYLLSVSSARALVRELHGNLVLRWCGGLDLDAEPWDHTTFAQNRTRRFNTSGLLEQLFDETVALAIKRKLVEPHPTLDRTLVQANASPKSIVPIEGFLTPDVYKTRIRSLDQAPGNPTVAFHGERRSNQTHVSTTDSGCQVGEQGEWDRSQGGLHRERVDGAGIEFC